MKSFTRKIIALILCLSLCLMIGCSNETKSKKNKHSKKDRDEDKKETTFEEDDNDDDIRRTDAPSEVTKTPAGTYNIIWNNDNYFVPTSDSDVAALYLASIVQSNFDCFSMAFFDEFIDMDMHFSDSYGRMGYEAVGLADFNRDGFMDAYFSYAHSHVGVVLSHMDGDDLSYQNICFERDPYTVLQMYDDGNGNYYVMNAYEVGGSTLELYKIAENGPVLVCSYYTEFNSATNENDVIVTMDNGDTTIYHDYEDAKSAIRDHYGIAESTIHTENYRTTYIPCENLDDELVNSLIDRLNRTEYNILYAVEDVNEDGIDDYRFSVGQLGFTVYIYEDGIGFSV